MEYVVPLLATVTVSVPPTGGTATATLSVPSAERYQWKVHDITITKGANTTITAFKVDGRDLGTLTTIADTAALFGRCLGCIDSAIVTGTNAGAVAEDLTLAIKGFRAIGDD